MDITFAFTLAGKLGIMSAMMIIGFFAKLSKGSLDDIARLVINFGLPGMIFSSILTEFNKQMLGSMTTVLAFGIIAITIGYLISYTLITLIKVKAQNKGEFMLSAVYGNTGFIGIPICYAVFGGEGALLAVMFDFAITLVLFSLGLFIFLGINKSGGFLESIKKLFNPPIISLFTGLLAASLDVKITGIVMDGITMVGNMTPPLAMIFIGGMLSQITGKIQWRNREILGIVCAKLLLLPIVMVLAVQVMGIVGLAASIIVIQSATPTMVAASLFSQRYKGSAELSTSAICVTTLLSLLTIPLIMLLL